MFQMKRGRGLKGGGERKRESESNREGKRKQEVSFSLSVSKDCIGKSTLALSGSIQREAFINYLRVIGHPSVCVCVLKAHTPSKKAMSLVCRVKPLQCVKQVRYS